DTGNPQDYLRTTIQFPQERRSRYPRPGCSSKKMLPEQSLARTPPLSPSTSRTAPRSAPSPPSRPPLAQRQRSWPPPAPQTRTRPRAAATTAPPTSRRAGVEVELIISTASAIWSMRRLRDILRGRGRGVRVYCAGHRAGKKGALERELDWRATGQRAPL